MATNIWEEFSFLDFDNGYESIDRLKVPGGWFVKIEKLIWFDHDEDRTDHNLLTSFFYPDPNHAWEIKK